MTLALTRRGHHVFGTASLHEARALLGAFVMDVALCDLTLPDGSGRDVRQFLPAHHPPVAAIAISGHAGAEDGRASMDAGFVAHLAKPIDFNTLQNLVQSHAGRAF